MISKAKHVIVASLIAAAAAFSYIAPAIASGYFEINLLLWHGKTWIA